MSAHGETDAGTRRPTKESSMKREDPTHRRATLMLAAVASIAVACGKGAANQGAANAAPQLAPASKAKPKESTRTAPAAGTWERLVMHPVHDSQGTLVVEMPFPASWSVNSSAGQGQPAITGPNGVKVFNF